MTVVEAVLEGVVLEDTEEVSVRVVVREDVCVPDCV